MVLFFHVWLWYPCGNDCQEAASRQAGHEQIVDVSQPGSQSSGPRMDWRRTRCRRRGTLGCVRLSVSAAEGWRAPAQRQRKLGRRRHRRQCERNDHNRRDHTAEVKGGAVNVRTSVLLAGAIWLLATTPPAQAQSIRAETGGMVIGGNVTNSNLYNGVPPEDFAALVRQSGDLSDAQKKLIARLEADLDLNQRQIRAALDILGEKDVPPERLAAKLLEIAERFKALQTIAAAQAGDDPRITALKAEAKKAVESGELERADSLLAEVATEQARALTEQARALDRLAVNAAETHVQRGDIALTRLRYAEAAGHFAAAAAVFPPDGVQAEKRIEYLER